MKDILSHYKITIEYLSIAVAISNDCIFFRFVFNSLLTLAAIFGFDDLWPVSSVRYHLIPVLPAPSVS